MRRWFTLIALSAVVALAFTVGAPAGVVQAASPPRPINVDPTVIKSAMTRAEAIALQIYMAMKDPTFVSSVKARNAGNASAAQTAALAEEKKRFKLPLGKVAPLAKTVGGVVLPMVSFGVGTMVGNGLTGLLGIDSTGLVCNEPAAPLLSVFSGVDCGGYVPGGQYVINSDAVAGVTGGWACAVGSSTACMRLVGTVDYKLSGGAIRRYFCMEIGPGLTYSTTSAFLLDSRSVAGGAFKSTRATGNGFTSGVSQAQCLQVFPGATNLNAMEIYPSPAIPAGGILPSILQYKVGSDGVPESTATTSLDPTRTFKCIIAGTNGISYIASTVGFKESSSPWPSVICPNLPADVFPTKTQIWQTTDGQPDVLLNEQLPSPEFGRTTTQQPECMDGSCILVLEKNGVSCFDAVEACADWFTDPNKESTYTCRYGTKAVELARCNVYRPTFKPDRTGDTYGDPQTGETLPAPTPNPPLSGQPSQEDSTNECFPTGWGALNPVAWVVQPVGCALRAAFVPRQSVVDSTLGSIPGKFEKTTPGKYIAVVGGLEFSGVSGCRGMGVNMAWVPYAGLGTFYFMPACPGDFFGNIAPLFKVFMYGSIAIGGFFGITRQIGQLVNSRGLGGE